MSSDLNVPDFLPLTIVSTNVGHEIDDTLPEYFSQDERDLRFINEKAGRCEYASSV